MLNVHKTCPLKDGNGFYATVEVKGINIGDKVISEGHAYVRPAMTNRGDNKDRSEDFTGSGGGMLGKGGGGGGMFGNPPNMRGGNTNMFSSSSNFAGANQGFLGNFPNQGGGSILGEPPSQYSGGYANDLSSQRTFTQKSTSPKKASKGNRVFMNSNKNKGPDNQSSFNNAMNFNSLSAGKIKNTNSNSPDTSELSDTSEDQYKQSVSVDLLRKQTQKLQQMSQSQVQYGIQSLQG